jgi:type III pantothenate kinase
MTQDRTHNWPTDQSTQERSTQERLPPDWLSLAIGNSRLHWAWFQGERLHLTWDTPHFDAATIQWLILRQFNFDRALNLDRDQLPAQPLPRWQQPPALWIASVVPQQTPYWQQYLQSQTLTLADVPLQFQGQPIHKTYPTLGLDRALTLWGALQMAVGPVLVIDAGTALTLTGADGQKCFVGGAILPGVRSLFQTLKQSTAALPQLDPSHHTITLSDRWATNTPNAIQSGIIHMLVAGLQSFIQDWQQRYPDSPIMITGGDAGLINGWLSAHAPATVAQMQMDRQLLFSGIKAAVRPNYRAAIAN